MRATPRRLLPVLSILGAGLGCTSTTVTSATVNITGIEIRSSSLVAGHGCGTGPDQVYRFAAVVWSAGADGGAPQPSCSGGATPADTWVGIFECYSDGVFSEIPTPLAGSQSFVVAVQAYSKAAYDTSGLPSDIQCAGTGCPADDPCTVLGAAPAASFTTTCSATQQLGIPVLAVCDGLEPADASSSVASALADQ